MSAPPPTDPLDRHRRQTEEVLKGGDPDAIKALYQDLGQAFWEQAAEGEAPDVPVLSAPETLDGVVGALQGVTGLVLDAGCGPNPAVAVRVASQPGATVVALDIGWGMVRTALKVASAGGRTLHGVVGDVENLPFRDGCFSALVCDDTIEHLPDDRAGVSELARVLRPGGRAVLATPNRHSAAVLVSRLRDRRAGLRKAARDYYVASSHLREYTWPEFERLVGSCFVIEARRPIGWREGRRRRLLTKALRAPALYRFSQMIALECRPRSAPARTTWRSGR